MSARPSPPPDAESAAIPAVIVDVRFAFISDAHSVKSQSNFNNIHVRSFIMGIDLPRVPKVYKAHRTKLDALRRSPLDWSMLCPGPMIAAPNDEPTGDLRLSVDEWPVPRPPYTYFLLKLALAFAFQQNVPVLTISYEDAAEVILNNLSKKGRFSHRRVGVALPVGLRNYKNDVLR